MSLMLSINTGGRAGLGFEVDDEPLRPVAGMCQDIHILVVIELETLINISNLWAGLEATFVQHPRFFSIWVCVTAEMFNPFICLFTF
jgi:hypothetical protein